MNYFDLFNLPFSYSLNLKELDRQYFALQVKYHPDKAINEKEKQEFLNKSTEINEGYRILKDEYERSVYMLKLHNIDLQNESTNYPMPPDILEQIWTEREELEQTQDIHGFLNDKIADRQNLFKNLGNFFEEEDYAVATIITLKLKYLNSLINNAKAKNLNAID